MVCPQRLPQRVLKTGIATPLPSVNVAQPLQAVAQLFEGPPRHLLVLLPGLHNQERMSGLDGPLCPPKNRNLRTLHVDLDKVHVPPANTVQGYCIHFGHVVIGVPVSRSHADIGEPTELRIQWALLGRWKGEAYSLLFVA